MHLENDRLIEKAAIAPDNPFVLEVDRDKRSISLIIIGYDYSQLFSIFSGILAASGLEIQEGVLTTTDPVQGRKLVIDRVTGMLAEDVDFSQWEAEVHGRLSEFYNLLQKGSSREEIQQRLVELVIPRLKDTSRSEDMLDAVNLNIRQLSSSTLIRVESSDTPFFLFSLGMVLNIHRLRIEHVSIETSQGRLVDSIEFTDEQGQAIHDEEILNRIKLLILITKQFTFFLDRAPDPAKALIRFDNLIQSQMNAAGDLLEFLASSRFHGELGRILGTSDFLWEDFIQVQQDNILPMLKKQKELLSHEPENVEAMLASHIAGAGSDWDEQVKVLNHFKNRQSFLIDMDHIMMKNQDFFFLSHRLSALADAVVRQACSLAWAVTTEKYGCPCTAGGLEAPWAVFGLGKLGGQALGYASDLELLFMFADNGETDGERSVTNRDFFERFFKQVAGIISAKKKGIFQLDLRLRPHGDDGPVAVKLDAFNDYFRAGGRAHSAERLALVRMRQIGGDAELGAQCLSLRDHIVYESDAILIPELRELRALQLSKKTKTSGINVKFSPGGLVDLEYNVQILQVIHGRNHEKLRGPGIHDALRVLSELGTIGEEETGAMVNAYRFYRKIINGLRMLRGNAEDLFLPGEGTREFRHLARRIGYKKQEGLSVGEQLIIDFETHGAKVRQFVERHLGGRAISGERRLSIVDLLLNNENPENPEQNMMADAQQLAFLSSSGFREPQRAYVNIQHIADRDRNKFIPLVILAWGRISQSVDPDMALNNWEQFVSRLENPVEHFTQLLSKPVRMDILFKLFSRSQFLADILIQNPGLFLWATNPAVVTQPRTQIDMEEALVHEAEESADRDDWRNRLRRARKKEILRIGLRDIALGVKIEEIMGEISFLARSCTEIALRRIMEDEEGQHHSAGQTHSAVPIRLENLSVLAFGKLGGWELNYSSDIDLLCIYRPDPRADRESELQGYTKIFRLLVQDIGDFTREGQAYRVDMRLRPYGASGPLVSSLPSIMEYYNNAASPWEFQAIIKLRPIAANLSLGEEFLENMTESFHRTWKEHDPLKNIISMREKSIAHHVGEAATATVIAGNTAAPSQGSPPAVLRRAPRKALPSTIGFSPPDSSQGSPQLSSPSGSESEEHPGGIFGFDVKNDHGGIRDIEFFLQGQQMLHSREYPSILTGNTLRGLRLLAHTGIISGEMSESLSEHYRFFRRVEHYLQLADNKQLHCLPNNEASLHKLIRCVQPGWPDERFIRYFKTALREVHDMYQGFVHGGGRSQ